MRLVGRVAIVTGTARGIGVAIAERLATEGARLVLADADAPSLNTATESLWQRGLTVAACVDDITTPHGNELVAGCALDTFGRVDIFHAKAGIAPFHDLLETDGAEINRTIGVNLTAAIYGCAAVLPHMVAQRSGAIILIASIAANVEDRSIPVYSATKGGLAALFRAIAVRDGPDVIRCNTICPGDVRTQMLKDDIARTADPVQAREAFTACIRSGGSLNRRKSAASPRFSGRTRLRGSPARTSSSSAV
jgi:NAD(P)-dependent dehydrogenase (short-subunit alcohol dehydrogenase family)